MKHTLATLTVGTVLAIAPGPSNADTSEEPADPIALAQLDGFALGLARAEKFSGVLLVATSGEVVLERAYGKRDAHSEDGNTVDTRFNLASAGKMFTAVAVLQQVAAGRLTLDTPVGEVLADYPNRDFAAQVTVRHLLTHAAGAGDIDLFGVENAANRAAVHSVAEMVALHAGRAPAFAPGSNQEYGNFGHVVLGRIVEVLSGESFEAYLKTNVFEPAGMTDTAFVDCTDTAPDSTRRSRVPSRGSTKGLRQPGPVDSNRAPVASSRTRKWSGTSETADGSTGVGQCVVAHAASRTEHMATLTADLIIPPIRCSGRAPSVPHGSCVRTPRQPAGPAACRSSHCACRKFVTSKQPGTSVLDKAISVSPVFG